MNSRHIGSSFDEFLEEEGLLVETEAIAIKRVVAFELERALEERGLNRTELADAMATSRAAVARLLDDDSPSVTLLTLVRAATAVGKRLRLTLDERSAMSSVREQTITMDSSGTRPEYRRVDEKIDDNDWQSQRVKVDDAALDQTGMAFAA